MKVFIISAMVPVRVCQILIELLVRLGQRVVVALLAPCGTIFINRMQRPMRSSLRSQQASSNGLASKRLSLYLACSFLSGITALSKSSNQKARSCSEQSNKWHNDTPKKLFKKRCWLPLGTISLVPTCPLPDKPLGVRFVTMEFRGLVLLSRVVSVSHDDANYMKHIFRHRIDTVYSIGHVFCYSCLLPSFPEINGPPTFVVTCPSCTTPAEKGLILQINPVQVQGQISQHARLMHALNESHVEITRLTQLCARGAAYSFRCEQALQHAEAELDVVIEQHDVAIRANARLEDRVVMLESINNASQVKLARWHEWSAGVHFGTTQVCSYKVEIYDE